LEKKLFTYTATFVIDAIDHMMAMKMINQVHVRKGRIRSFTSYCGGLPSPEAANNPLAYKFRYLLELLGFKTFIFYGFLSTFQT
jgi:hypothetical protein